MSARRAKIKQVEFEVGEEKSIGCVIQEVPGDLTRVAKFKRGHVICNVKVC